MTDHSPPPPGPDREPIEIDPSLADPARMYNYWRGGEANFAADRNVADYVTSPDTVRTTIRAMTAFAGRTLHYLVAEAGIRQFLNVGTLITNAPNVHDVVQELAPEARVVYVIRNTVVLAHAHRLLDGTPEGATAYVHVDRIEPDRIIKQAAETLDFAQPVAVTSFGMLNWLGDDADPQGIVARLMEAVSPGSYLVIEHLASDLLTGESAEMARRYDEVRDAMSFPFLRHSYAEVSRFFEGLELVDPGLVQIDQWRHGEAEPTTSAEPTSVPCYGGVGRKR